MQFIFSETPETNARRNRVHWSQPPPQSQRPLISSQTPTRHPTNFQQNETYFKDNELHQPAPPFAESTYSQHPDPAMQRISRYSDDSNNSIPGTGYASMLRPAPLPPHRVAPNAKPESYHSSQVSINQASAPSAAKRSREVQV